MALFARLAALLRDFLRGPPLPAEDPVTKGAEGGAPRLDPLETARHEIRTPLSGLIGMAELLAETPLAADQRHYVESILASGRALADLVDDLLEPVTTAATGMPVARPFAPAALVENIVELLAPRAQACGLEIAGHVAPDVPAHLLGDPGRLRQVLLNLAGNAIKYTASGGIALRAERQADAFVLRMLDTGPGVAPDRQAAIFDLRTRAVPPGSSVPGSGLGLALSRQLIAAMGGSLTLEASGPHGSTFALRLPLRLASEAGSLGGVTPEPAVIGVAGLAGRRVSIVGAGPFEADFVAARLAAAGARAERARDLDSGLARLASGPLPDVLIVDGALGEAAALHLAAAGRQAGIARRLVLVSPVERRAMPSLAAFDGWLVKPVRTASLLRLVGSAGPGAEAPSCPNAGVGPACGQGRARSALEPDAAVLVAEDDPVHARLVEIHLARLGTRAIRVADGAAAVAAFAASCAPPPTQPAWPRPDGQGSTSFSPSPSPRRPWPPHLAAWPRLRPIRIAQAFPHPRTRPSRRRRRPPQSLTAPWRPPWTRRPSPAANRQAVTPLLQVRDLWLEAKSRVARRIGEERPCGR